MLDKESSFWVHSGKSQNASSGCFPFHFLLPCLFSLSFSLPLLSACLKQKCMMERAGSSEYPGEIRQKCNQLLQSAVINQLLFKFTKIMDPRAFSICSSEVWWANLYFTIHRAKLKNTAFLVLSKDLIYCKFKKNLIKSRTNINIGGRSITFHDTVIWWLTPVVHFSCSRIIKGKMSSWHSMAEMSLLKCLWCAINIFKESFKRILSRLIDLRLHQLSMFGFLHNSATP